MLERIGNCRIVDEVASGGMAVVYRAIHDDLNRTVAIKVLKEELAEEEQLALRFVREAQSLAALQHENIINVYDFHRDHGQAFIVMEYVEGIDIYDLLDRCGRLPFDVATVIAIQVARALDYVHYRNVVHRDIKPANIMVSRQGGVKLMDFGIARDDSFDQELTQSGMGIGTPSYMSPEQILGDKLDATSDIFSLGIVLYQMVTGKKPFVESAERSVMNMISLEPHVPVRKLNPELPRELERIIDKCLQKEPRRRWRSGQSLVMALERFLAKYVEMNYHTRLVLYLKNQDIITQLEADEYLNPQLLEAASPLSQKNVQMRKTLRKALTVQGSIMGVVALMVALIHLAPVGATVPPLVEKPAPKFGHLRVVAHPWAEIVIDGKSYGHTPMAQAIRLPVGEHQIELKNEYFSPRSIPIEIQEGEESAAKTINIDLQKQEAAKPKKSQSKDETNHD